MNYLGLLFPMMVLNFAIAVGIVRYRRRQIDHVRRLRARQLEEFEAYKKEVAGELHDHFGQVKMQFAKLLRARGEEVDPGLASAIVDLEGEFSSINEVLYPAGVETGDVGMLLQRLASLHPAIVHYHGPQSLTTTPQRALHIFRIIQETVSNAVRHSAPKRLDLDLTTDPRTGAWRIACTYDTTEPPAGPSGSGRSGGSGGRGQTILASRLSILRARRTVDRSSADARSSVDAGNSMVPRSSTVPRTTETFIIPADT